MNVYTITIVSYFLFIVLISFLTRKVASKSSAEYFVAGRNLGVFVGALVVAAEWLGGMSTIGVSEKAFKTGTLQPILYNIATATGMIIIGFTVAYHYRKKGVHTVSEMLETLFGHRVKIISAICFLIAYITLAYIQLQTCASVFAPLLHISWNAALIISLIVITFYTYVGGMHALVITNIVHVLVMFLGLGTVLVMGLMKVGGLTALHDKLVALGSPQHLFNPFSAGVSAAISLLLGGILGGMAAQASIQPIFSTKDPKTAKMAAIVSSLIIAPFGMMSAFLALIAKTGMFFDLSTLTNAKMVLPKLLTTSTFVPPILGGLALAGILAAILSTVGPVNFAVVTIATKDIYQGIFNKKADDKKILQTARRMVILVSLITLPLALFIKGAILDAAYVSYAIRAIGAIVIILGIYRKNWISPRGAQMAFIGGTITIFVCIIAKKMGWFSIDKTYGAVGATIFFIILDNLLPRKKAEDTVTA